MSPIEFLSERLSKIANIFPEINIKGGYNSIIETYVVVITPEKDYYNNRQLDLSWIPVSIEFNETFPYEEVSFVSTDSSISFDNLFFEFNPFLRNEEEILAELFSELTTHSVQVSFTTIMSDGFLLDISSFEYLKNPVQNLPEDYYDSPYLAAA